MSGEPADRRDSLNMLAMELRRAVAEIDGAVAAPS
jgi:hypothetical protein